MKRDISTLEDGRYDVIVVGGGIHGATVYYQLAAAGLKVALLEKTDFCAATSANSLKILHGGLRYLQHLNIKRMRESINSRKYFMQMAPHLIKPMPCIMPTYGLGMQGKPVMGVAMMMFDIISWDRNQGAPKENKVGHGALWSREKCLELGPGIESEGLTGAALWYDDLITNTERMALAFIKRGCELGSTAANYVKVKKLIREGNKITGIEATDELSGKTFKTNGSLVINAAGPWIDELRTASHQAKTTEDLSKAVNIVIEKALFKGHGVGLSGSGEFIDEDAKIKRGKRLFFFAPWKDRTIIGTTYSYFSDNNDDLHLTRADIEEILDEVNIIYPQAELNFDDVIFAHAGLMPAHKPNSGKREGTPQLVKHSRVIDHESEENISGLLTIEGVKYTTAPSVARDVEKLLIKKKLIKPSTVGIQHETSFISAENEELQRKYGPRFPHIKENFGDAAVNIFKIDAADGGNAAIIRNNPPLLKTEVIYCIREEMAVKLADVIFRRTDAGTTGCPGAEELRKIASVMAAELGWDEDRIKEEINSVIHYYRHTLALPS